MLIASLFFLNTVKAIVHSYEPAVVSDFTKCLTQLVEDNFKESGDISFVSTNNDNTSLSRVKLDVLKNVSVKLKHNVRILTATNVEPVCEGNYNKLGELELNAKEAVSSTKYYIVIIETYKEFPYAFKKLICSHNWNPSARFIILIFDYSHEDKIKETIEKIFTHLFQYNVLKVAIVIPQVKKIRRSIVYSWKPLDPPEYCGFLNETAENRILVENVCDHGIPKYSKDLFKNTIPFDMKNCALNVLALKKNPFVSEHKNNPNIEINLINKILTQFNFKMNYQIVRDYRGEREKYGNWSGALKLLASKQGQMLFGGIFPDYDVHQDFECSTSYLFDWYTWVVPRAYYLPPWRIFTNIFKKSLWSVVIGIFVMSVLLWRLLGKLNNDSAYNQDLNHCFLNAWITAVGFSNYARPFKNSLRVFCAFFNIHCILLLTAYQTKLTNILRHPSFDYQIKTTKELVASGLRFGGFEQLQDIFINSGDPFDQYVGQQWINVIDMRKALIDVAVHRNFSVLCSRMELTHLSMTTPELKDMFGHDKYFAFEKNIFTVPIEMISLKGFPFMPEFSKLINYFKQNGINAATRRQVLNFNMKRQEEMRRKSKRFQSLSFKHLQGAFLALVIGYVSGVFVLCIEKITSVYQRS